MKGYTKQSDIKHGLPRWHNVKNPPANAGNARDMGSIPGSERSPGEGNGNPPKKRTNIKSSKGETTNNTQRDSHKDISLE